MTEIQQIRKLRSNLNVLQRMVWINNVLLSSLYSLLILNIEVKFEIYPPLNRSHDYDPIN